MRIALISTPFLSVPPRDYGGTELVIYELAEGLVEAGHEVTLFATGDSCTKAELRFLYLESQWPPHPLTDANHVSWALRAALTEEYDLIHVHSAVALAMSRWIAGVPMVYTIHHDRVEELSRFYRHFPEVYFVAISRNQKQLEGPLPNCEVIYHGLNSARFECVNKPQPYVCFVGRYSEQKGPHLAIDAAERAHVLIQVAGEAHEEDHAYVARELKERLHRPHVRDLGPVNTSQKVPLLRDARALLAPLQWEEPFGLIMIEAMLSGCPVVAFPRGSAPELIEPGVTGFLVETPEEMSDLIGPGSATDLFDRRRCRQRAQERFSRQRCVADHLQWYQRIRAQSPQAAPADASPSLCRESV